MGFNHCDGGDAGHFTTLSVKLDKTSKKSFCELHKHGGKEEPIAVFKGTAESAKEPEELDEDASATNGYKHRVYQGMAASILKELPLSILNFSRNQKLYSIVQDDAKPEMAATVEGQGNSSTGYKYSALNMTEFSPDVVEWVYSFFLNDQPGAKIYDPFSGRSTRGIMAFVGGYSYYGIDLMQQTVDDNNKRLREIKAGQNALSGTPSGITQPKLAPEISFVRGDSCNAATTSSLASESFDFALTCPPYWDLEVYSNDPDDISTCKTYEEFLAKMQVCFNETYRVLKPQSFFVFVANYFRHEGRFYHLANDLVKCGQQVGFKWYDEVILNLKSPRALRTMSGAFRRFHTAKSHEYMEVMYKNEYDMP
jgi:SAM-dependent methyltransferase